MARVSIQHLAVRRFQAQQGAEHPVGEGSAEVGTGDDEGGGEVLGQPDRAAFRAGQVRSAVSACRRASPTPASPSATALINLKKKKKKKKKKKNADSADLWAPAPRGPNAGR